MHRSVREGTIWAGNIKSARKKKPGKAREAGRSLRLGQEVRAPCLQHPCCPRLSFPALPNLPPVGQPGQPQLLELCPSGGWHQPVGSLVGSLWGHLGSGFSPRMFLSPSAARGDGSGFCGRAGSSSQTVFVAFQSICDTHKSWPATANQPLALKWFYLKLFILLSASVSRANPKRNN